MNDKPHLTFWADISVDAITSTLTRDKASGRWSVQFKVDGLLSSWSDENTVNMEDEDMRRAVEEGRVDLVVVSGRGAKLSPR